MIISKINLLNDLYRSKYSDDYGRYGRILLKKNLRKERYCESNRHRSSRKYM